MCFYYDLQIRVLGTGNTETSLRPVQIRFEMDYNIAGITCGGRHTMVWLDNGHVYSFGNNFYAQLGYDFNDELYKENQLSPHHMKFSSHRPVQQITCGDKHSLFLFQDGSLAAVGSNLNGQIGSGDNMEAVIPKQVDLSEPIKSIASGANHNLAITNTGHVYMWGYAKACGQRRNDILVPERVPIRHSVVKVACGTSHCMALTANGNIYTWGSGTDGQLGHPKLLFLPFPKKLKTPQLYHNTSVISCGESFSAAISSSGQLFMWGKNSDTVDPSQKPSYKQLTPSCMNTDIVEHVSDIKCGGWHAVALTGMPDLHIINDSVSDTSSDSDRDSDDDITTHVTKHTVNGNSEATTQNKFDNVLISKEKANVENFNQIPPVTFLQPRPPKRQYTKQTIGEFYASSTDSHLINKCVVEQSTPRNSSLPNNHKPPPYEVNQLSLNNSASSHEPVHSEKVISKNISKDQRSQNLDTRHLDPNPNPSLKSVSQRKNNSFRNSNKTNARVSNRQSLLPGSSNSRNVHAQTTDHVINSPSMPNVKRENKIDHSHNTVKLKQEQILCSSTKDTQIQTHKQLFENILAPEQNNNSGTYIGKKINKEKSSNVLLPGASQSTVTADIVLQSTPHIADDVLPKNKPKTKISMDFIPQKTPEKLTTSYTFYREKSIVSPRELNIMDVEDIHVKRSVNRLLQPKYSQSASSITNENRKELDNLLSSILPRHLKSEQDINIVNLPRSKPNSNILTRKPPKIHRQRTVPGPNDSNVTRDNRKAPLDDGWCFPVASPPARRNISPAPALTAEHRTFKPVFSSASSWRRRGDTTLLLGKIGADFSGGSDSKVSTQASDTRLIFPSSDNETLKFSGDLHKCQNNNVRKKSLSANYNRMTHPRKPLQRKLSS
ncbi:uncharacterized protein LOC126819621 isoform X2 [Patella vulgata]|uniref:uncharacterized protein LOC126819621 isoform X2 n=1 Tax=Patella vulgata TaxID=6465 RepID=UPI00217F94E4|nr:uncharacterized protein LOC126819621 isoform X2 [Patella vulgata]